MIKNSPPRWETSGAALFFVVQKNAPQKTQKDTKDLMLHLQIKYMRIMNNLTKKYLKELTYSFNGACIEVHKALGPGLLESVYHKCLKQELLIQGIPFQSEFSVPVHYKGINVETELRCDLLVANAIVIELKSVELLLSIHEAQILTYMKLLHVPKGILINFNVGNIYNEGQKTFVNEIFRNLPD